MFSEGTSYPGASVLTSSRTSDFEDKTTLTYEQTQLAQHSLDLRIKTHVNNHWERCIVSAFNLTLPPLSQPARCAKSRTRAHIPS